MKVSVCVIAECITHQVTLAFTWTDVLHTVALDRLSAGAMNAEIFF